MKKEEYYATTDLHLAAYLISSGNCKLESIESQNGWKCTFVLRPMPSGEDINHFYGGTAEVSALRLCDTMRSLKAAVKVKGL